MIFVIDFGSQTAHLIGRRIRQLGIDVAYVYPEEALPMIREKEPTGIIFSGGPADVFADGSPMVDPKVYSLGIPILGICYGEQLIVHQLGGKVSPGLRKEYGPAMLKVIAASLLLKGIIDNHFRVWMSHGNDVIGVPPGFVIVATTTNAKAALIQHPSKNIYCTLFHPEVQHTTKGNLMLRNFAEGICKESIKRINLSPDEIIRMIKQTVMDKKVICAVSGGVDSTVVSFLIGKAIGKNVIPVYVDSGLMRPDTDTRVKNIFTNLIRTKLVIVDAKKRFLQNLKGINDPEIKRKIIGKLYVDIFQEEAKKYRDVTFLGQGTIYSDVIESKGSKHASHIKSHHNVGGLPKNMKLQLLEPLRNYYKDEVRKIGKLAGLPEDIINQQPFPGPGHAINVMGEVTKKRLDQVIQADQIVVEELKKANIYDSIFECFAVMTGAYSTAVKGDGRVFAEVVAIRCIDTKDLMTVEWTRLPYKVLAHISSRIINEVPDVSRVVYDITPKPPATVRWE